MNYSRICALVDATEAFGESGSMLDHRVCLVMAASLSAILRGDGTVSGAERDELLVTLACAVARAVENTADSMALLATSIIDPILNRRRKWRDEYRRIGSFRAERPTAPIDTDVVRRVTVRKARLGHREQECWGKSVSAAIRDGP